MYKILWWSVCMYMVENGLSVQEWMMEVIEAHLICVQRIRYDLFPLCDTYLFCLPRPLIYDWYRMYKLTDWRTADRWRVDVPDTLRNCEPVQTARIYNGSGRTHNRRLVVKSFRSTTFNFSPVPSHKLKTECRQAGRQIL